MNKEAKNNSYCPKVCNLLCEYAQNPLGVDNRTPGFSWALGGDERGLKQSAYRVLVASSEHLLEENTGDLWDSGKVISPDCLDIRYGGVVLKSAQRCYWKVCIWTGNGEEMSSGEAAWFEMGLLKKKDWKGKWLGFAGGMNGSGIMLRKEFTIEKGVDEARAYIAGLGYYELRINGRKVGDHVLDPGLTDCSKRVLYAAHDVTQYLHEGKNVIGIVLGNGWYGAPKALLQMNIYNSDGTKDELFTDWGIGWNVAKSHILYNSIFDGEIYDARLEEKGWDTPEYDMYDRYHVRGGWIHSTVLEPPGGELVSQMAEPIRVVSEIEPVSSKDMDGKTVYDLGQNISGWASIKASGERGAKITLRFAETLHKDGSINQNNLRNAQAKDVYILSGDGQEAYTPRFTYHGFRYIEAETEGKAEILQLKGQVVRSDVAPIGKFECSKPLINKIHNNIWWTEADNLHSIPTDCPQRDERQGWLNDATSRAEEAFYNFDMSRFYVKWINDIADTQTKEGSIADTAPHRWGKNPADPLVSCYLIIPILLYRHCGNKKLLRRQYKGMKAWFEYLGTEAENDIIIRSVYGDWASPVGQCEAVQNTSGAVSAATPGALVSTGYFYLNAKLLSEISDILGLTTDKEEYEILAKRIKKSFNGEFFDPATKNYAQGSQGANSLALKFGLVEKKYKKEVLRNLVNDIEMKNDFHLTTGNQCTKHMMETLADNGYLETAYRILTQTTYPSWGYMIENGATTIWERWELEISDMMNSRNHPMHASIGSWLYMYLGGIRTGDDACGFDKIIIKPHLPKALDYVKSSLQTVRGEIVSNWKREGASVTFDVKIPANCTCKLIIPLDEGKNLEQMILTESGTKVWEAGKQSEQTEGIVKIRLEKGLLKIDLDSGQYSFSL